MPFMIIIVETQFNDCLWKCSFKILIVAMPFQNLFVGKVEFQDFNCCTFLRDGYCENSLSR